MVLGTRDDHTQSKELGAVKRLPGGRLDAVESHGRTSACSDGMETPGKERREPRLGTEEEPGQNGKEARGHSHQLCLTMPPPAPGVGAPDCLFLCRFLSASSWVLLLLWARCLCVAGWACSQ